MSGGSYDYAYSKLDALADEIRVQANRSDCAAKRVEFSDLLRLCAKAAKAIEWVDSCDTMPGDEIPELNAALGYVVDDRAEGRWVRRVRELEARLDAMREILR